MELLTKFILQPTNTLLDGLNTPLHKWENLHGFDQGFISYIIESLNDILGKKTEGKAQPNVLASNSELLPGIPKDKLTKISHVVQSNLGSLMVQEYGPKRSLEMQLYCCIVSSF